MFVDALFEGYDHIIAIVDKKTGEFLPILDENGQVGFYNTGRLCAKYSFRTMNPKLDKDVLHDGFMLFTKFWMIEKSIENQDRIFDILVKKLESASQWESDVLKKNLAKNWQKIGHLQWKDGEYSSELPNIEEI